MRQSAYLIVCPTSSRTTLSNVGWFLIALGDDSALTVQNYGLL